MIKIPHFGPNGVRAWTRREGDEMVTRDLDDVILDTKPIPPKLTQKQTAAAVALALAVIDREEDIIPEVSALAGVVAAGAHAGADVINESS